MNNNNLGYLFRLSYVVGPFLAWSKTSPYLASGRGKPPSEFALLLLRSVSSKDFINILSKVEHRCKLEILYLMVNKEFLTPI